MSILQRYKLEDKIVVLTGATGILGKRYSLELAKAGAQVVIADLDESKCKSLAADIFRQTGLKTYSMPVDLRCEQAVAKWAKLIFDKFQKVDVLVNNAATKSKNFFSPLDSFPLVDWQEVMAVNVTGIFLTCREIGSVMAKNKSGNIINISSIYGVLGPDQRIYEGSYYDDLGGAINTPFVYSASKGAVISMTKYLATYWGHVGIRANTLTPGGVASGQNEIFNRKYSNKVPLGRMADADEIVSALLFLCSDASSYINGQNIIVDGGWTAW